MPKRGSRGNSVVSVLRCLLSPPTSPGTHRKGGSWEHGPGCGWQGEASLTQSSTLLGRLLSFPKEPSKEGSADKLSGPTLLESRPWSSQSAAHSQRPERGWARRRAKASGYMDARRMLCVLHWIPFFRGLLAYLRRDCPWFLISLCIFPVNFISRCKFCL